MILAIRRATPLDRPPTWKEDLAEFFFHTAPGSFFGLPLFTLLLAAGKVDSAIRRSLWVAAAIGWAIVGLVAVAMTFAPEATLAYKVWGAIGFSAAAAIIPGSLMYNRVRYGYYL